MPGNAAEIPAGAIGLSEDSNMTGEHTLNEVISSRNSDLRRQRRSLQSIYPVTDQGRQTNRASLMTFDSIGDGNMGAYQFAPPQAQNAVAGSVHGSLFSSGEDMQVEHQPRGSVNSDGQFSGMEPSYGTSSFRHPVDPFGYNVVATYTSPTGGPAIGFDQGIASQIAPAESPSINLFPLSTYAPVAQGSIPGVFPRHNSQDFRFPSGVMDQQDWLGGVSTLGMTSSGPDMQNISRPTDCPSPRASSIATQLINSAPPQQSPHLIAAPLPVSSKSSTTYIPPGSSDPSH